MNNVKEIASLLSEMGRNGDTMLAHITPEEARVLEAMGGSGTINPVTGLPEYWGGFFGGLVNSIGNAVSDVVSGVGSAVSDVGSAIDDAITQPVINLVKEDPLKAAALALAGYGLYSALAPGVGAGALAAEDAAFIAADASQLAAQGLSEAQIAQTLGFAGADAVLAADAASLAAQGLSESAIAQNLAQQPAYSYASNAAAAPALSTKQILDTARLGTQLLGGQQQQSPGLLNIPQRTSGLSGSISYEPTISLLTSGRVKTPSVSSLIG